MFIKYEEAKEIKPAGFWARQFDFSPFTLWYLENLHWIVIASFLGACLYSYR